MAPGSASAAPTPPRSVTALCKATWRKTTDCFAFTGGRTVALRGIPPEAAIDAFRALLGDDDTSPESATETRHNAWARTMASR